MRTTLLIFGGSSGQVLENKTISSAASAIQVRWSGFPSSSVDPRPTIRGNTLTGLHTAINVPDGSQVEILDNVVIDSSNGILLADLGDAVLGESVVRDNQISGGHTGLDLSGTIAPEISGNTISGTSTAGVRIARNSAPILTDNTVCDNARNLDVEANAAPVIDDSNEICADEAA